MTAATLSIALVLGSPCFPCLANKRPATLHGFLDASSDPDKVRELWSRYPGPLIGVPTGAISGLDVLDLDLVKHAEAANWLKENREWLPVTRVHRTRSGGLHILFTHATAVRNSQGRVCAGIDVRGDGGYIIWWPAIGCSVLTQATLAPWPPWLLLQVLPLERPRPPLANDFQLREGHLRGLARAIVRAPVGKQEIPSCIGLPAGSLMASGLR